MRANSKTRMQQDSNFIWLRAMQRRDHTPVIPRALTIPQAAKYLSTSVKFIRSLIWRRELKYVRAGKRFVIATAELDRWLSENQRHA